MIDKFSGKYRFLSNFYVAEFTFLGEKWPTAEHAFQAMKTEDGMAQAMIRAASTAYDAKRLGRRVKLRDDWEDVKFHFMYAIVLEKFLQNPDLAKKLLATGDAELVEGNTWGDYFWGKVDGVGENHLGEILMMVREDLR